MLSGSSNLATALQVLLLMTISVTAIQYMLGSWLMWSSVKKFAYQKVQGVVWNAEELPPEIINASNTDFTDYSNTLFNKTENEYGNLLKLLNKSIQYPEKGGKKLSRVKRTDSSNDMSNIEKGTENMAIVESDNIPSPSPLESSPLPSPFQSFSSSPFPSPLLSDSKNEKTSLSAKRNEEE